MNFLPHFTIFPCSTGNRFRWLQASSIKFQIDYLFMHILLESIILTKIFCIHTIKICVNIHFLLWSRTFLVKNLWSFNTSDRERSGHNTFWLQQILVLKLCGYKKYLSRNFYGHILIWDQTLWSHNTIYCRLISYVS